MIVIADDITGAAEMAGIAHRLGYPVHLQLFSHFLNSQSSVLSPHPSPLNLQSSVLSPQLLVLATDTRGMNEREAVAETRKALSSLSFPRTQQFDCCHSSRPPLLFKKTDSALRGHVIPELVTLMETMGYQRAVYLPANPSKKRIVKDGTYYVDDIPLDKTAFSYDPEFPAKTSVLKERFPDAERHHIIMPDAESLDDIRHVVEAYNDGRTLFAGAADLFEVWLNGTPNPSPLTPHPSPFTLHPSPFTLQLLLCGSTQSKPLDIGLPEFPMPRAVYDGESPVSTWIEQLKDTPKGAILSFGTNAHRRGKDAAVYLRNAMAEAAVAFISRNHPQEVIIEGGATAFCLLIRLGWHHFHIVSEIAPGVVRMELLSQVSSLPSVSVTLKPGSYPWGKLWENNTLT